MRFLLPFLMVLFVGPVKAEGQSDARIDPSTLYLKTAFAARISTPPIIDGDLGDPVWQQAMPVTDLLQTDPENLVLPTERTEVRIIYDDENLYVGFRNYDSEAEKMVSRLARRDTWISPSRGGRRGRGSSVSVTVNSSDWVGLALDARNDKRTAFNFVVNVAGAKLDAYIYDDERYDRSWDGVWDVQVQRDSQGWTAEFRLPFSLFNFPSTFEMTWGLSLKRFIYRKQERIEWPGKQRGVQGNVSRFGVLKGLQDIPPPKQVEIVPYGLGGYYLNGKDKLTRNIGLDMEYGLGSNTTLNLTVNPDFGQVEADPSVLNLTAFETFYEEKRPFFVEGASFFENPSPDFEGKLFHSRRIGKKPGYFSPPEGKIVGNPDATTILGAAKLLGKMSSGLEFGVVEAVTDEEYGTIEYSHDDTTVMRRSVLLEPYTNHFVGRLRAPIINDLSTVGLMITDQRRQKGHPASTAAIDWRMKFYDNRVSIIGQMMKSHIEDVTGNASRFYLAYDDPVWWSVNLSGGWYDDSFDINDLGFLKRAGIRQLEANLGIRRQDPWGPFLRNDLRLGYEFTSRSDGTVIDRNVEVSFNSTTMSYWSFGTWTQFVLPVYNDNDTFKDSRAWIIEESPGYRGFVWLRTDSRKWLSLNPAVGFGRRESGSWGYRYSLSMTVRPTQNLSATIRGVYHRKKTTEEWVGIEASADDYDIVYSESSQLTRELTLRLNWTFSPDISFQTYLQPFRANVNYFDFKSLQAPKTLDFEPYEYTGDPDFKIDNTVGTFVLRWEYLLGSTIYVVYNLNDSNEFSASDSSWSSSKSNTVFIKLNYWFQM